MDRIVLILKKTSTAISVAALSVMVLLIVTEILLRFFRISTMIADEYSGYLMVTVVFIGSVLAFDEGSFVRVEVVYQRFSGKLKFIMDFLFHLLLFAYALVLSYFIWELNWTSLTMRSLSSSVVQTPLYIPQFLMSLGIFLFDVYLIIRLVQIAARKRVA